MDARRGGRGKLAVHFVVAVSATLLFACAQSVDPRRAPRSYPQRLGAHTVSSGPPSCALRGVRVYCWPIPDRRASPITWTVRVPTEMPEYRNALDLFDSDAVVLRDGTVLLWGFVPQHDGSYREPARPEVVPEMHGASHAMGTWGCWIRDAQVRCWRIPFPGGTGIVGSPEPQHENDPVTIDVGEPAEEVVGDLAHQCARLRSGRVVCWGIRTGQGAWESFVTARPSFVAGLERIAEISGAMTHCARRDDGHVLCWGSGAHGSLGNGDTRATGSAVPVEVRGLQDAVQISVNGWTGCAVRSDGTVACWGARIGYFPWVPEPGLRVISGLHDVTEVSANHVMACARDRRDDVWCWGQREHGALGDGTDVNDVREEPMRVPLP